MRYLVVLLLAGCGAIEVAPDAGSRFSIEHGSMRFNDAMAGARAHCAKLGQAAYHAATSGMGDRAVSRFECVEKK